MRNLLGIVVFIGLLFVGGCQECEYSFTQVTVRDCGERGVYVDPAGGDGFYVQWSVVGRDVARKLQDCGRTVTATDVVGDRCERTFSVRGDINCD